MKFRKKPVVVEAIQFIHENIFELQEFAGKNFFFNGEMDENGMLIAEVRTLEDGSGIWFTKHIATQGDWIIKGVQGEFYACKPDIFEATYESADIGYETSLVDKIKFLSKYSKQQSETITRMTEQKIKDVENLNKVMMKLFELAMKHNEPLFKDTDITDLFKTSSATNPVDGTPKV